MEEEEGSHEEVMWIGKGSVEGCEWRELRRATDFSEKNEVSPRLTEAPPSEAHLVDATSASLLFKPVMSTPDKAQEACRQLHGPELKLSTDISLMGTNNNNSFPGLTLIDLLFIAVIHIAEL